MKPLKPRPHKDFAAERFGDCIRVNVPVTRNKEWAFYCLATFDRHWDNPKSDQFMQKEHLEEVYRRRGCWFDGGDLFCAMQGKYDKRASKDAVRPEHQQGNYLDALVNTAGEFFRPYADRCLYLQHGNHETGIYKRHETDLTERLVAMMNRDGAHVLRGNFNNITIFRFNYGASTDGSRTITLNTDHGWGGGGPVTQDVIQHQRRASYLDADIVVSGHTHDSWVMERMKLRVNQDGRVGARTQLHLKVPTYKDDYGTGKGGWHVETGKPPKPLGAWWLKFTWSRKHSDVLCDAERAR